MVSIPTPSSTSATARRARAAPAHPGTRPADDRRWRGRGVLVLAVLTSCAAALPTGPPPPRAPVSVSVAALPGADGDAAGPPSPEPWDEITLPGGLVLPASLLRQGRTSPTYVAPVPEPLVRARFDPPAVRWSAGHRGVDLDAQAGTPVRSPGAGVVVHAAAVVDRGVVTVRHPDGLRSSLEPVTAQVAVGAVVAAGDLLGLVQEAPARTHCDPRCLHWGVRDGQTYLNPMSLLATEPVVLLPLGEPAGR